MEEKIKRKKEKKVRETREKRNKHICSLMWHEKDSSAHCSKHTEF